MRKLTMTAALLWPLLAAGADAPNGQDVTWQEANKRSAALIREKGPSVEAADLARMAFDLYPVQTAKYRAQNHAQLLLNLTGVRESAQGAKAALDEIDHGSTAMEQFAGPGSDALIAVWHEAARLAHGLDASDGYAWMVSRLAAARARAAKAGEDSIPVAEMDVMLATAHLQNGQRSKAIETLRQVMDRLESRNDQGDLRATYDRENMLQTTYGLLVSAHEDGGDAQAAAEVRKRGLERWERPQPEPPNGPYDELRPVKRVEAAYPGFASNLEGLVVLQVDVNPDGTVADVQVLRSRVTCAREEKIPWECPGSVFNASAVEAVRQWKFKPKMVDGKAVSQSGVQRLRFNPKDAASQRGRWHKW